MRVLTRRRTVAAVVLDALCGFIMLASWLAPLWVILWGLPG